MNRNEAETNKPEDAEKGILGGKSTSSEQVLTERQAYLVFKAYFNNKMTPLLLMLQSKAKMTDQLASCRACMFLDDLYRHMLAPEFQKQHHLVFLWLRIFFTRFPFVGEPQKRRAAEYIKLVYRLIGFKLELNLS